MKNNTKVANKKNCFKIKVLVMEKNMNIKNLWDINTFGIFQFFQVWQLSHQIKCIWNVTKYMPYDYYTKNGLVIFPPTAFEPLFSLVRKMYQNSTLEQWYNKSCKKKLKNFELISRKIRKYEYQLTWHGKIKKKFSLFRKIDLNT